MLRHFSLCQKKGLVISKTLRSTSLQNFSSIFEARDFGKVPF